MALSGMIQKTFYEPGGVARFAYRLYWSATQNIANNTSTVTVTAKLAGLISTSTIVSGHSSSATTVVLAGTTTSKNNNISISGITEKTLHTTSKTITHNTNGTGSFTLSGTQVINATFNGTYVGTVSIGSTTLTLDTIPRASTFTALGNFTTGSNPTCTIRRQSTTFTNTVRIKVGSTTIKTLTGQGDLNSLPLNDTTSINAIINALPNAASGTLTVEVDTMSGSTKIGSTVSRTCTVTIAGSTFTALGNFTTGSNPTCTIRRSSTLISHTIRVKLGSTLIKTLTGQGDLNSIVVNDSVNTIINGLPNSTTGTITVEVDAMHGTAKVGSTLSRTCTVTINSSILPTLTSITHSEQNSTVSSIVGAYVQGLSSIKLTLNGAAAGQGSSIKGYEVKYNNAIVSHTVNITPSVSGAIPISARVQDNRSRWSTPLRTATATVLAYRAPAIVTFTAQRSNSSGTVQAAGTSAKVVINANVQSLVNGTEKNSITATTYYRLKGASTWTLAKTTTGTTSISTNFVLSTFALANAYEWRLVVTDKFQSQESIVQMGTGKVIAAIAPDGRFGIGQFPEAGKALTVGGDLAVDGNLLIKSHPAVFRQNIGLDIQNGDYRRSVIAFAQTSEGNSWCTGILNMHRVNGLSGVATAHISIEKRYNASTIHSSILKFGAGDSTSIRPCTFTYGGVKYGGVEVFLGDAHFVYGELTVLGGNFTPFGLDYYDTRGTVLNAEVNNSIEFSSPTPVGPLYYNGASVGGSSYTLPTASASTLGGVKVGSNLSISSGVLSAKDTTYGVATTGANGLMSAADKTKLNSIATGATADPTTHGSGNNISYRFANGLQISVIKISHNSQNINTAWGTLFESGTKNGIAYSVPFVADPSAAVSVGGTNHCFVSYNGGTASMCPHYALLRPTASTGANYTVKVIAIGRWK